MVINVIRAAQTGLRRQADAFSAAVKKVTNATLSETPPAEIGRAHV